MKLNLMYIII